MRKTALLLGFGLVWVSFPAAAETAPSGKSASARPEARIGSLAPDEARRAERARRRAAEKNAKAAARDTNVKEGKSVAVPGNVSPSGNVPPTAVVPRTTAAAPAAEPKRSDVASRPAHPDTTGDKPVRDAAAPRDAERVRSAGRDDRVRDRRDRRYAARRKAHRERFAVDGAADRRFARQGMIVDDPRQALPSGAPPYPMAPRPREAYMVRVAPPPPPFWGYGPRPFYSMRAPVYMHEPVDDVD